MSTVETMSTSRQPSNSGAGAPSRVQVPAPSAVSESDHGPSSANPAASSDRVAHDASTSQGVVHPPAHALVLAGAVPVDHVAAVVGRLEARDLEAAAPLDVLPRRDAHPAHARDPCARTTNPRADSSPTASSNPAKSRSSRRSTGRPPRSARPDPAAQRLRADRLGGLRGQHEQDRELRPVIELPGDDGDGIDVEHGAELLVGEPQPVHEVRGRAHTRATTGRGASRPARRRGSASTSARRRAG